MNQEQSVKRKVFADHVEDCSKEIKPPAEVEGVEVCHFKVTKDVEPA